MSNHLENVQHSSVGAEYVALERFAYFIYISLLMISYCCYIIIAAPTTPSPTRKKI